MLYDRIQKIKDRVYSTIISIINNPVSTYIYIYKYQIDVNQPMNCGSLYAALPGFFHSGTTSICSWSTSSREDSYSKQKWVPSTVKTSTGHTARVGDPGGINIPNVFPKYCHTGHTYDICPQIYIYIYV